MLKGQFADRGIAVQILLLLFLALLGTMLFTGLGMGIAASIYDISSQEVLGIFTSISDPAGREIFKIIQGFSTIGTFLVPAVFGSYLLSHHPEEFMGVQAFPKPALFYLLLLGAVALGMGGLSDLLYQLSAALPWPESFLSSLSASQDLMMAQYESILAMNGFLDFMQVFLVMALLPAVAEEALFRGCLQPLIQRYLNTHIAIWLTAFLFALLHQQYLAFLSIFFLGAVLGYLREWTGSIWVPTLLHLVNNGSIVIAVFFFDLDYRQNLESELQGSLLESGLLVGVLMVALLAIERISRKAR